MVLVDFALLSKYGISFPPSRAVSSSQQAAEAAQEIGFPIAMKIISPAALHKSDKGGVILNIASAAEADKAYSLLMERFEGAKVEGVLVQKMCISQSEMHQTRSGSRSVPMAGKGAIELIVGGKRDPQFGQLIMLGAGGIFVEVFKDVTFRVCPITKEDALEMMRELRAYPILAGARGSKPVNQAALASTLVRVSQLLQKEDPAEFDINPLMADEKGCMAVDVRILK